MGGLADGANEKIVVDGTAITLGGNSSGTTTTNGMSYTVTIVGGTATVALTKAAGVSAANINTLINGITYQNTNTDNPTAGSRTFTLTQIQDSGGSSNGGVDTSTLSIASTVTVTPVNDAPTLTATASDPTFTEAAGLATQAAAVSVFSSANANTIEAARASRVSPSRWAGSPMAPMSSIVVDGTAITLGGNSSGTTPPMDELYGHDRRPAPPRWR